MFFVTENSLKYDLFKLLAVEEYIFHLPIKLTNCSFTSFS